MHSRLLLEPSFIPSPAAVTLCCKEHSTQTTNKDIKCLLSLPRGSERVWINQSEREEMGETDGAKAFGRHSRSAWDRSEEVLRSLRPEAGDNRGTVGGKAVI